MLIGGSAHPFTNNLIDPRLIWVCKVEWSRRTPHHRTYQEELFHGFEANDWPMSGQGGIHQLPSRTGRNEGELLRGATADFAIRQRLLQLVNLSLGEVGVVGETQQP